MLANLAALDSDHFCKTYMGLPQKFGVCVCVLSNTTAQAWF